MNDASAAEEFDANSLKNTDDDEADKEKDVDERRR